MADDGLALSIKDAKLQADMLSNADTTIRDVFRAGPAVCYFFGGSPRCAPAAEESAAAATTSIGTIRVPAMPSILDAVGVAPARVVAEGPVSSDGGGDSGSFWSAIAASDAPLAQQQAKTLLKTFDEVDAFADTLNALAAERYTAVATEMGIRLEDQKPPSAEPAPLKDRLNQEWRAIVAWPRPALFRHVNMAFGDWLGTGLAPDARPRWEEVNGRRGRRGFAWAHPERHSTEDDGHGISVDLDIELPADLRRVAANAGLDANTTSSADKKGAQHVAGSQCFAAYLRPIVEGAAALLATHMAGYFESALGDTLLYGTEDDAPIPDPYAPDQVDVDRVFPAGFYLLPAAAAAAKKSDEAEEKKPAPVWTPFKLGRADVRRFTTKSVIEWYWTRFTPLSEGRHITVRMRLTPRIEFENLFAPQLAFLKQWLTATLPPAEAADEAKLAEAMKTDHWLPWLSFILQWGRTQIYAPEEGRYDMSAHRPLEPIDEATEEEEEEEDDAVAPVAGRAEEPLLNKGSDLVIVVSSSPPPPAAVAAPETPPLAAEPPSSILPTGRFD